MSVIKSLGTDKRKSSESDKRKSELDEFSKSVKAHRTTIGSDYRESQQLTQEDVLTDAYKKSQTERQSTGKAHKQRLSKNKCKHCLGACFREFCEFLSTCLDSLC